MSEPTGREPLLLDTGALRRRVLLTGVLSVVLFLTAAWVVAWLGVSDFWLLVLAAVNTLRRDIFGTVVTPRGKGRDKATSRRKASREKRKDNKKRTSTNPLAPKDLLVTGGPLVGTMLPLGEAPIVIGRSPACTLVLEDEYASSRHAALTPQSDGWWIEDLSSRNGTFIDDERLSSPRQLKIGDVIRIGQTTLELVG